WEQAAYGVDRGETLEMFETSVEIVHQLLTETDVVYNSLWWSGGPATVVPEATQKPMPREWLTAVSHSSIGRAARRGMNCVSAFWPEEMRRADIQHYHRCWAEAHPARPAGKYAVN